MPAKYHKGAKKAYESGRSPVYSDVLSAEEQKETERMLREQIRRKVGSPPKRKKFPKAWEPKIMAINAKAKKRRASL